MSLRFRKTITILPGVRLNIGKSGITSISIGPRGLSFTFSFRKGDVHSNVGIPGSGVSFRKRIHRGKNDNQKR